MGSSRNFSLGADGEGLAARFLIERGFRIVERNYRFGRHGEIDIIAEKDDLVIFVEVKHRTTGRYGGALYSIGTKKKGSIKTVARAFLAARPDLNLPGTTFRFDLISVGGGAIDWVEDMFR